MPRTHSPGPCVPSKYEKGPARPPPPPCDITGKPLLPSAVGLSVGVHFNLQNGCWSVTYPNRGKVLGYAHGLAITDAVPKVSLEGYKDCRYGYKDPKTGRHVEKRNVHAYILGTVKMISVPDRLPTRGHWRRVRYNCRCDPPRFTYAPPFFYYDDAPEEPLTGAAKAIFLPKGILYVSED